MALSLYLIDDHPLVRTGLVTVLEQAGHTIVGMADDVDKALADLNLARCGVVVLDLSLGSGDATRDIPRLAEGGRRVMACSMHEDAVRVRRVFAAGATGYVTKREAAQCLLEAVAEVAAGRRYVSPRIQAALLADEPPEQRCVNWECLSDREREVVWMLSEGISAEEIAQRLSISPRTVEGYYARINLKLAISGVKELRRLAIMAAREGHLHYP